MKNPCEPGSTLLSSPHQGTAGCVTAYKGLLVSDSVLSRPRADDSLCRQQRSRVPSCPRVPNRRQRGRQNKWEMDLLISFAFQNLYLDIVMESICLHWNACSYLMVCF